MEIQTIKNRINRKLDSINRNYHPEIPLDEIFQIVEESSGDIVDVDGSKWDGMLCGDNSSARFDIQGFKFHLNLSWYRMPSGRFEITAYVS